MRCVCMLLTLTSCLLVVSLHALCVHAVDLDQLVTGGVTPCAVCACC